MSPAVLAANLDQVPSMLDCEGDGWSEAMLLTAHCTLNDSEAKDHMPGVAQLAVGRHRGRGCGV